jgi:glycosyltransferase involved in cell wall biosynthesis
VTPPLTVLIPGDPNTRTGGYGYDRRIVSGLRAEGWQVAVVRLSDDFPHPSPAALAQVAEVLAALPDGALVLADGLALGAMPTEAGREARRLRLVALVHHPLAMEAGLSPTLVTSLETSERAALAEVRHVVVTSRRTAASLQRYDVPAARTTVVEPGTDAAPLASGSKGPTPHLLCVAAVVPRKGHDLLADALSSLRDRSWHLTCVGSLDRDSECVSRFSTSLAEGGLTDRVHMAGDLDEARVNHEYDRADVFVLATRHEGYGMAVAEAIARGVPVVSTATGAIPELVEPDAGLAATPGDCASFTTALGRVLDDHQLRLQFAVGARARRASLPSWTHASEHMSAVLSRVAHESL